MPEETSTPATAAVAKSMGARFNSQPLGRRVALLLGFTLLSTIGLFVWYGQQGMEATYQQFENRSTVLARSIANEGTLGMIMQDDAGLSEQLERVVEADLALAAAFVTPAGSRFAQAQFDELVGTSRIPRRTGVEYITLKNGGSAVIAAAPVVDGEGESAQTLGTAFVVLSAEEITAVERSLWMTTGLVAGLLCLIIGLLLWATRRVILKPVDALRIAAQQVQAGNYAARVPVTSQDEIGQLSGAFNEMVAEQERSTEKLRMEQKQAEEAREVATGLQQQAEHERGYLRARFAEIADVIEGVTQGDLTRTLHVENDDEVGQLMQQINRMIYDLNGLIHEVHQATGELSQASNMVATSAEEMSAGAQDQADQTGMVAAAVEEMSVTAAQASTFAEDANQLARQASTLAAQGETVFQKTTGSMTRIAGIVRESTESVSALGASSAQIGEIIEVIGDIASQTNLLALNAAIEAARAGEHGHGFAVVADEVRKLAERTSQATREIADMIKRIQANTNEVVVSMTRGNDESETGLRLAEDASALLGRIVGSIGEMVERIDQIALGSEQQASTSASIARNVEAIAAVSSQTSEATHVLARTADEMSGHVQVQRNLITRFRLREHDQATTLGRAEVTQNGFLLGASGDGASGDGAGF